MAIALDLITSNPALDAYNKAEELALKAELQDQKMRASIREEREAQDTWGQRQRKIEADTSLSEIRTQGAADELPTVGPRAQTALRTAKAGADTAEAEASVALPKAQAGLRSTQAAAASAENAWFSKSIELASKGDIEGAKAIAAQYGHTIPDEYLNDADMRAEGEQARKDAVWRHKDRPQDQDVYIRGRIEEALKRKAAGGRASDPAASINVPGAPTPQETSDFRSRYESINRSMVDESGKAVVRPYKMDRSTGDATPMFNDGQDGAVARPSGLRAAGGAGVGSSSATERIISELMQRGHSYEESLAMAKRAPNADQLALRKEALALSAAKADVNYMTNPAQTIKKYRQEYGIGVDAPAPVAPAPGPQSSVISSTPTAGPNTSPQRPEMMSPGNGQKPLDIQSPPLPPNLPQGVQYSWSPARQQFKDELGRVYDKNGNPV